MTRDTLALIIAVVTLAGIVLAFLYATRQARSERRAQNRGERQRRRNNLERIAAKKRFEREIPTKNG